MKKALLWLAALLIAVVAAGHWYFADRGRFTTEPDTTSLQRTVSGNRLISPADPAATLHFDNAFRHIGGHHFILYGVADTEQHFFVETTADEHLKAVYWIQYEAYLPGKPYSYDYSDSPLRLQLGDYEFFTDAEIVKVDPERKRRRGTDGDMARRLLASQGYQLPMEFTYSRMVYLTDESRQKELMIIFIEDLASYGARADELLGEGADQGRADAVLQQHLERIRSTLSITPL